MGPFDGHIMIIVVSLILKTEKGMELLRRKKLAEKGDKEEEITHLSS